MTSRRGWWWPPLAVWLLAFSSCRLAFREQPRAQCTTNKTCTDSNICFLGKCARSRAEPAGNLVVELQNNTGVVSQQRITSLSSKMPLVSPTRVRHTGSVTDATSRTGVNGRLSLSLPSLIAGRQVQTAVSASNLGRFVVDLEPGTYNASFLPESDQLPPFSFGQLVIEEVGRDVPLIYPSLGSLSVISGRVLASQNNELPVSARVYLDVIDSALSSTVAQTDDRGFFTLRLAPGLSLGRLLIGPSAVNEFVPQRTSEALSLSPNTTLDTIYLDDVAASALLQGRVIGTNASGLEQGVGGASVYAEVTVGNSGIYRTGTRSDASGGFTLALITGASNAPLDYRITAVPPPTSEFGRSDARYTLQPIGEPAAVELRVSARSVLSGRVSGADGALVSGVQVIATAVRGQDSSSLERLGQNQTTTSDLGRFTLTLDMGRYEISVRAPADTGQPWHSEVIDLTSTTQELSIVLAPPALVAGELLDANDAPVAQTTLEWFTADSPTPIGRAVTDSFGHFSVVLPGPR